MLKWRQVSQLYGQDCCWHSRCSTPMHCTSLGSHLGKDARFTREPWESSRACITSTIAADNSNGQPKCAWEVSSNTNVVKFPGT